MGRDKQKHVGNVGLYPGSQMSVEEKGSCIIGNQCVATEHALISIFAKRADFSA